MEGYTRSREERNPFSALFGGPDPADSPPDRFEVDLDNPASFERQMFDEILFDDPTLPDCRCPPVVNALAPTFAQVIYSSVGPKIGSSMPDGHGLNAQSHPLPCLPFLPAAFICAKLHQNGSTSWTGIYAVFPVLLLQTSLPCQTILIWKSSRKRWRENRSQSAAGAEVHENPHGRPCMVDPKVHDPQAVPCLLSGRQSRCMLDG